VVLLSPSFLRQLTARYKPLPPNQHWLCGVKAYLNEEMSNFRLTREMEGIGGGKKVKLGKMIDEERGISSRNPFSL